MGANRPSLQQRDGRLDPKGLIYNPKLPILCDVCCYYFAVFPKRKLEYHPFSTLSSLESIPSFLFYQNTRAWWSFGTLIRLKWVLFSLYPPLRPFSLVAEEWGCNSGEHIHSFYLPVQVTAEMNYPLVSQSCIKLFLICPTANVTTSKAVMTSRYGNHTFTIGTSSSVCMSSEMSLRVLNMFRHRGQGNPGLKYLPMTDDLEYTVSFSQSCQIKFKYQIHNQLP